MCPADALRNCWADVNGNQLRAQFLVLFLRDGVSDLESFSQRSNEGKGQKHTTSRSIGSSSIILMFASERRPTSMLVVSRRFHVWYRIGTLPCDIKAWTLLAPFSCKVRAARVRVVPVSIMSSNRMATYNKLWLKKISTCSHTKKHTLSFTCPTNISIRSGAVWDFPSRFR